MVREIRDIREFYFLGWLGTLHILRPEKLYRKKHVEIKWIFRASKLHRKSTWKQRGFFDHQNYAEKSTWKQHGFFDQWNYVEKSTWKRRRFFYQQNYIKKVRGNDGKYVKFGLRRINVISTSNRRGMLVGLMACDLIKGSYKCSITIESF